MQVASLYQWFPNYQLAAPLSLRHLLPKTFYDQVVLMLPLLHFPSPPPLNLQGGVLHTLGTIDQNCIGRQIEENQCVSKERLHQFA